MKGAGAGHAKDLRDNAWFEGFAPRKHPEIVVVALFEHGVHGQYAAPIVRDVIKAYFDKKARRGILDQQQAGMSAKLPSLGNSLTPVAPPTPPPAESDYDLVEKSKIQSDVPEGLPPAPKPLPEPKTSGAPDARPRA